MAKDCSERQVADGVFEFSNTDLDGVIEQLVAARKNGQFDKARGSFTIRLMTNDLSPTDKANFIARP